MIVDPRLEEVARGSRDLTVTRLVGCGAGVILLVVNLGLGTGLLFALAMALAEVWTWFAVKPLIGEGVATARERVVFASSTLFHTSLWVLPSVLYWFSGHMALQIVAIVTIAGCLIHAAGFAFQSRIAMLLVGGPHAACLFILPIVFGGFHGVELATVATALSFVLLYVVGAASQNFATLAVLRQTERSLREQTEAAVTANRAKSSFLAMMSHELRTPMNGVLGMAHVLSRSELDHEQRTALNVITDSSQGLMTVLNDILDLSKVEAGKIELEVAAFNLPALVRAAATVAEVWAREKDLAIKVTIAADAALWVSGDVTRVRQILLNLLSNAVKFTERGAIELNLDRTPYGQARISVFDTGVGIAPDAANRLFQPFVQEDASTTRRYGGTGLGLVICRQLARLMGGDLDFMSTLGEGSTFITRLELPDCEAPAEADDSAREDGVQPGLRVLVADDNINNRAVARAFLVALACEAILVENGEQALAALCVEDVDLVLMDIHMPGMDGVEATRRIRAGETRRSDIPIVALTADAMSGDRERFLARGFDEHLPKPLDPAAFAAVLGRVSARAAVRSCGEDAAYGILGTGPLIAGC